MEEKGLLVVSFGTSYQDTREKNIAVLEEALKQAHPDRIFYRAYTSGMIRKKIKEDENVFIPSVNQALEQMIKEGITDLLVQPTHIISGIENDIMKEEILKKKEAFSNVLIGRPLLEIEEDYEIAVKAVLSDLQKEIDIEQENTALVLMGHGSEHEANASYGRLQKEFLKTGHNIYVGTVEGTPDIEDVRKALKEKAYEKVILIPFMIVAGDHARNDMAGDEEDAWKVLLKKDGYDVTCMLKGLGESPAIRNIFVEHSRKRLLSIVSQ